MADSPINETLDRIAAKVDSAETLNTLHACRPGHPLGRDNDWKWRNAYAAVEQLSYHQKPTARDLKTLAQLAALELAHGGLGPSFSAEQVAA